MNSRLSLSSSFSSFRLLAFLGLLFISSARAAERPNIIVFLTDDQRWDALGCAGNPIIRTPNIDQLASEGILFKNNFCTTSICAISRATFFTGQYARRHGINDFSKPLSPEAFAKTYPALLRAAGYRTGFIGKYGLGGELPRDKFDYFGGFEGQGTYYQKVDGKEIHLTRLQAMQALEFLKGSSSDQPFCLSISFKAPHVEDRDHNKPFPYDPAYESLYANIEIPRPKKTDPRYWEALPEFIRNSEGHSRWQYEFSNPELYQNSAKAIYRLITGVDETIGEIMADLRKRDWDQKTIVIFTSDNGFFMGERGLEGKWLMYEESIRTPLIIRDPSLPMAMRAATREAMTLNLDIAPTALEYAGINAPDSMQGRSLKPLIHDSTLPTRSEWFYEHRFDFGGKIPETEGVRTDRWKYTRYVNSSPLYEELFDLKTDPEENHNRVHSEDAESRAKLNELRDSWSRLRESCR